MVTKCTDEVGRLIEIYGPILGGVELRRALGFKSVSAFNRAIALGRVSIPFFAMEGRRGRFARTSAVAEWLSAAEGRGWPPQVRQSSRALHTQEKAYPRKSKETARTRSATQGKKPTRKKEGAKM
jgi:hypothetical protein